MEDKSCEPGRLTCCGYVGCRAKLTLNASMSSAGLLRVAMRNLSCHEYNQQKAGERNRESSQM